MKRSLRLEKMEQKRLLAGDVAQNDIEPLDVNDDQAITALDALNVINGMWAGNKAKGFLDVNGDGKVTTNDARLVINGIGYGAQFATASINDDGVLSIRGTNQDDFVQVNQTKGTRTVELTINDDVKTFGGVQSLDIRVGNGNDEVAVNTFDDPDFLISSVIRGGNGDDILQGGGGSDVMFGGNGSDIVTNFVTDENYNPVGTGSVDQLFGGNGDDFLWGGWGVQDIIRGGNGNDAIYDIVGGSNDIDGGNGDDFVINRGGAGLPTDPLNNPGQLTSDVNALDRRDSRVVAFDAATQANGPVIIDNTLYVLNLGGGDIEINNEGNSRVIVLYNGQEFTFKKEDFTVIAGLGGGDADDSFVNNTGISSVFYGLGGDDVLIGGNGDDVLKGGSGDDYIDGRGGLDDITGDAGEDQINAADGETDVVRIDALDLVFADAGKDRIVVKRNLAFS
jgi:Ca2+-binding RTX toxin-like protein